MLAKSIFYAQQTKEAKSNAQIFNLSWNDTQDWIYDRRVCDLKDCEKMKSITFKLIGRKRVANKNWKFAK